MTKTRLDGSLVLLALSGAALFTGFFALRPRLTDIAVFQMTTMAACLLSLALFFTVRADEDRHPGGRALKLFFVVLNGAVLRFYLAYVAYGNNDMDSWRQVADIVARGGNPYVEMNSNYSPVWFWFLAVLRNVSLAHPALPFHFLMKSVLTFADLWVLACVWRLAPRGRELSCAAFFFLNPVSMLITGFHGQTETVCMALLLTGVLLFRGLLRQAPAAARGLLWAFATAALIIKHNVFYELIVCLNAAFKKFRWRAALFVLSSVLFTATFLPYSRDGLRGILDRVFLYASNPYSEYGLSPLLLHWPALIRRVGLPDQGYAVSNVAGFWPAIRHAFVLGLAVFPFFIRRKEFLQQLLLGTLFFLAFTTGFGVQYLVLPVALGALRPSKGFLAYTAAASLLLLGWRINMNIPFFHFMKLQWVWLAVLAWFAAELREKRGPDPSVS